jgi:putative ABC transport system substrate-binding protein
MSKIKIILIIAVIVLIIGGGYYIYINYFNGQPSVNPNKSYKIGVLQTAVILDVAYQGFKTKMTELGYIEGKNISYDYILTQGDMNVCKQQSQRFMTEKYDLIYTIGVIPAKAAREVTSGQTIPVVFSIVSDPVGNGIVNSLQTSGNNIAGVTPASHQVSGKRVELLKEAKPDLKRIVFPYNNPTTTGLDNMKRAAQDLGIQLLDKHVANVQELDSFLNSFKFERTDALIRSSDSVVAGRVTQMISLALENKIPLFEDNSAGVQQGALISYGADYGQLGGQAAVIADKIFKGASPAGFPVDFPQKFELTINRKTADTIGLKFTSEFIARVDKIY